VKQADEKNEIERFLSDLLLARLQQRGFSKPKKIVAGDRPDLTLHFSTETIGLEVTRGVFQEYVRGGKLRSRFPNVFVTTTHLVDGDRRRPNQNILEDLFDPDPEWKDASQEFREWETKLEAAITSKREDLNHPSFRRYDQNWLLIYDEPAHNHHAPYAAQFLSRVTSAKPFALDFDVIFLLSGKFLFACRRGSVRYDFDQTAVFYELR
jgi:hypothetical protein